MGAHSSILAWRIPWTEEPGGLPSIGSQKSVMTEETWHEARCTLAMADRQVQKSLHSRSEY